MVDWKSFLSPKIIIWLKIESTCMVCGKFSEVIEKFGMQKRKFDHSVFYRNSQAYIILLVVYVDNMGRYIFT